MDYISGCLKVTPRDWQTEAFNAWINNNKKGTIKAVTGTGKTTVGLMALIQYYFTNYKRIYIIVKTISLQQQWRDEILTKTNIPSNVIGYVGNGMHDDETDNSKSIIIGVINSLRKKIVNEGLLIEDECHGYMSEENFKFIDNSSFDEILGLSATPERKDGRHKLFLDELAPIVYDYDFISAKRDNNIAEFSIVNIGVNLTSNEMTEYKASDDYVKEHFPEFGNNFNYIISATRDVNPQLRVKAFALMRNINKRKKIVFNSSKKLETVLNIVDEKLKEDVNNKIIVFCEYIELSKQIAKEIKNKTTLARVNVFNSKLNEQQKTQILLDFKSSTYNVLVVVKSFDEGMDVPDANIGIIQSGSGIERQFIQRLGRILRKKEGKKAILYQVYVNNTKDYDWLKERMGIYRKNDNVEWQYNV